MRATNASLANWTRPIRSNVTKPSRLSEKSPQTLVALLQRQHLLVQPRRRLVQRTTQGLDFGGAGGRGPLLASHLIEPHGGLVACRSSCIGRTMTLTTMKPPPPMASSATNKAERQISPRSNSRLLVLRSRPAPSPPPPRPKSGAKPPDGWAPQNRLDVWGITHRLRYRQFDAGRIKHHQVCPSSARTTWARDCPAATQCNFHHRIEIRRSEASSSSTSRLLVNNGLLEEMATLRAKVDALRHRTVAQSASQHRIAR